MKRLTKLIKDDKNLFKGCWLKPLPKTDVHKLYLLERRRFGRKKNVKI